MKPNRHPASTLGIMALFNTAIALVLHFMVIPEPDFWEIFVISHVTGFSISTCIHQGMAISEKHLPSWAGLFTGLGLILGILISGGINWAFLSWIHSMGPADYYGRVFSYILVFGCVFSVPIIYFFTSRDKLRQSEKRIQEEKIKRLTMERESAYTTLRLLQAQIEPHFLFNTLSTIQVLMETEPATAGKMLTDLNGYLRISLERTRQEAVTLSQELDLVRQYLGIFKIRMGKRLWFDIEDRTGMPDLPFPPLILQPLVENALKYGIEPLLEGGKIRIICEKKADRVEIRVMDTGCGLEQAQAGAGIGMDNVSRRLESIYGNRAGLTLGPGPGCGTTAIVEVPL